MKTTVKYVCQECGYSSPKWLGKCPSCNEWNTLTEELEIPKSKYNPASVQANTGAASTTPKKLSQIKANEEKRFKTYSKELDRVLGGGIVPAH